MIIPYGVKGENIVRYIVPQVATFVSCLCARTRRTQYPSCPTYSRRTYMAITHGCGEIDEGYCFSTPPVKALNIQFEGRRTMELTNGRIHHDATNEDRNDVGSQG